MKHQQALAHLSLRQQASLVVAAVSASVGVFVILAGVLYITTPRQVELRFQAAGLPTGQHQVVLRAVDTLDLHNELYKGSAQANITAAGLQATWTPPKSLAGKAYIVEACVANTSGEEDHCFSTQTAVQSQNGTLISCPYYVSKTRSGFYANLFHQNSIDLDNRLYCPDSSHGVLGVSVIETIKEVTSPGLALTGSSLAVSGGGSSVSTENITQLIKDVLASEQAAQAEQTVLVPAATGDSDNQTLTMTGRTISISGGNTVVLPAVDSSQQLSVTGAHLQVKDANGNGTSVDLTPFLDNTDNQALSWDPGTRILTLQNGGAVLIADTAAGSTYVGGQGIDVTGKSIALAPQGAAAGQVLKWNGAAWVPSADIDTNTDAQQLGLGGNSLTLTNGGMVDLTSYLDNTDSQTLGYDTVTRGLTIVGGNTVYFPLASGGTTGLLSSTDYQAFSGKENVLTFDTGLVRSGNTIGLMSCASGKMLKSDGTTWLCADDIIGTPGTTYSAGTGLSLSDTTFNNTGILGVSSSGALTTNVTSQNAAVSLQTNTDFTQTLTQLSLSTTGVTAGTYNNVTVDAKGRVTSGTNISYLTTEADSVVGNEVAGVVNSGGLVMTGAGTSASPYKVGLVTTCADNQLLKYTVASGWSCANDNDTVTVNTDNQTLSWNTSTNMLTVSGGNTVDLGSLKDNTDAQAISLAGNTLSITGNAGTVDLTKYLDNTDSQALTLSGNTLTLANGGTVDLSKYIDNVNQSLSIAGNVISLTNGGSVTLPADQNTTYSNGNGLALTGTVFSINAPTCNGTDKLQWNGSAFVCAADVNTDAQTLSWSAGTRTLSISSGNQVNLPDTNTDSQTLGYDSATNMLSISGGNSLVFPAATSTVNGLLSAADYQTFNGKENVLTVSDGLTRSSNNVSLMSCATNQILQRNSGGTAWLCANQVQDTNTTYTAGTGLSLVGTTFANTGILGVSSSGALTTNVTSQNAALTLSTTSNFTQNGNTLDLSNTGVTAGTYNNVTVDAKGRVTSGTNISYLTNDNDAVKNVVANGGLVMTGSGTSVDPYKVGLITTCLDNQLLKYTVASGWACANDNNTANTDNQTLSWNTSTNVLTIAGGNSIDLSSLQNADQSISLSGDTLTLSNGGTVDLSKYLDNTNQTLSFSGDALSLTNGGTVDLSKYPIR